MRTPVLTGLRKAKAYVVRLAKKHAKDEFERAPGLDASGVRTFAGEAFWNVVFPVLENAGFEAAAEVDGRSLEDHYIDALVTDFSARQARAERQTSRSAPKPRRR